MGLDVPHELQQRDARFTAPPHALCAKPKTVEDGSGSDSAQSSEAAINWLAIGECELAVVTRAGL
eukprot:4834625-Pleurochrysis_carterae.AAC.1